MIEYQGMRGSAGDMFDGKCIDIESPISVITGDPVGAGFFTCIPISPWSYRKSNPTKASVTMEALNEKTLFHIFSDWGERYDLIIDNDDPSLQNTIDHFKSEHLI